MLSLDESESLLGHRPVVRTGGGWVLFAIGAIVALVVVCC
jgi:hypothetical protein